MEVIKNADVVQKSEYVANFLCNTVLLIVQQISLPAKAQKLSSRFSSITSANKCNSEIRPQGVRLLVSEDK